MSSVVQVRCVDPSGRTCCVPNTLPKVRMKIHGQRDAMEIVGIEDQEQFVEDVRSIGQGSWAVVNTKHSSEHTLVPSPSLDAIMKLCIAGTWPLACPHNEGDLDAAASAAALDPSSPYSRTNPLFDSAMKQHMVPDSGSPEMMSPHDTGDGIRLVTMQSEVPIPSPSTSPDKLSPLDLAISNSRLLTPEATCTSVQDMQRPGAPDSRSSHSLDARMLASGAEADTDAGLESQVHGASAQCPDSQSPYPTRNTSAGLSTGDCNSTGAVPDTKHTADGGHSGENKHDGGDELFPGSWCWEVDSSTNDTIELSSIDSETQNAYESDLEEMVKESRKPPKCGKDAGPNGEAQKPEFNLMDEIQPYDGPPLGCEAAEYWGPEWLDDDGGVMEERLLSMTKVHPDAAAFATADECLHRSCRA